MFIVQLQATIRSGILATASERDYTRGGAKDHTTIPEKQNWITLPDCDYTNVGGNRVGYLVNRVAFVGVATGVEGKESKERLMSPEQGLTSPEQG